ncbi:hypothetical protein Nepgr_032641 [Nepenthes gracilis]|uniref:Uncharacterized protein n=1 Tax=Nepenthes gracilis TaxID=150966 RepID=A0AAD3TJ08_NEPGR|nr:hypothetical protein Nepgr_032641 [Nepenthes gracilis]
MGESLTKVTLVKADWYIVLGISSLANLPSSFLKRKRHICIPFGIKIIEENITESIPVTSAMGGTDSLEEETEAGTS